MPELPTAIGMGVIILLVAVAIPAAITTVETDATVTFDMSEGDRETVTQQLRVILGETSPTDAEIRLRDASTLQEETKTLNVSETEEFALNGDRVNVTLVAAEGNNQNATVAIEYERTYGWDDGAVTLIDSLPLILSIIGFVVIVGTIGAVMRSY